MQKPIFHDANIYRVSYNESNEALEISLRDASGHEFQMTFTGDLFWDFSPFERQNVLFDLKIFDSKNAPASIYEEYDIPRSLKETFLKQIHKIAILEPSVGLGGFIFFKQLNYQGSTHS